MQNFVGRNRSVFQFMDTQVVFTSPNLLLLEMSNFVTTFASSGFDNGCLLIFNMKREDRKS